MSFKAIYLELLRPLYLAKRDHLCNFCRSHHEEQFCEIILNLKRWFRRCRFKDNPYLELWRSFCSAEQNNWCNFGKEHYEEQSKMHTHTEFGIPNSICKRYATDTIILETRSEVNSDAKMALDTL